MLILSSAWVASAEVLYSTNHTGPLPPLLSGLVGFGYLLGFFWVPAIFLAILETYGSWKGGLISWQGLGLRLLVFAVCSILFCGAGMAWIDQLAYE